MQQIAYEQSGRSAAFQHSNLLTALKGRFRFRGSNRLQHDLLLLERIAAEWPDDIGNRIGGVTITRPKIQAKLDRAIADHRFVQIQGAPGTGKSAVFRQFIERHRASGPVLFIKSGRLDGRSWQAFARSIGLECTDAKVLLHEIGALGLPCLCIDGIDRIEPAQRNIVIDLLRVILGTPELAGWRVIVTARDGGVEPLRNWLPSQLFASDGVGIVEVKEFDNDETRALSEAVPSLSRSYTARPMSVSLPGAPFLRQYSSRNSPRQTLTVSRLARKLISLSVGGSEEDIMPVGEMLALVSAPSLIWRGRHV